MESENKKWRMKKRRRGVGKVGLRCGREWGGRRKSEGGELK